MCYSTPKIYAHLRQGIVKIGPKPLSRMRRAKHALIAAIHSADIGKHSNYYV